MLRGAETKIYTYNDIAYDEQRIIFAGVRDGKRIVYNFYTGERKEVNDGEGVPIEFIMKIPTHIWNDVSLQLAELLDKDGIKTDNDHKIQGIMEAQKYHLEDMRKLVFKNK